MKSIESVVAENITKLLYRYNITKLDLAKIADVSESTVGKWTLKKRCLEWERLKRFLIILEYPNPIY